MEKLKCQYKKGNKLKVDFFCKYKMYKVYNLKKRLVLMKN